MPIWNMSMYWKYHTAIPCALITLQILVKFESKYYNLHLRNFMSKLLCKMQPFCLSFNVPYEYNIFYSTTQSTIWSTDSIPHWGWDNMVAIFQTKFSVAFSWKKTVVFCYEYLSSFFPVIQLTIIQHWLRSWLVACSAPNHYLKQWWTGLLINICISWCKFENYNILITKLNIFFSNLFWLFKTSNMF